MLPGRNVPGDRFMLTKEPAYHSLNYLAHIGTFLLRGVRPVVVPIYLGSCFAQNLISVLNTRSPGCYVLQPCKGDPCLARYRDSVTPDCSPQALLPFLVHSRLGHLSCNRKFLLWAWQ